MSEEHIHRGQFLDVTLRKRRLGMAPSHQRMCCSCWGWTGHRARLTLSQSRELSGPGELVRLT